MPDRYGAAAGGLDAGHDDQDRAALAAYTIHFAYDSAVIRDSEKANLQSVASALAADPNAKLLIEGNCDERGTEEYNRALGEKRALAAREALAKLNVDPMRVRTDELRQGQAGGSRPHRGRVGRRTAATISCCCIRRRECNSVAADVSPLQFELSRLTSAATSF